MNPLESAIEGWRKTKHARFAAIAELATKRALPEPRLTIGNSGKAVDVKAWVTLYEQRDVLDVPRLFAAVGGGKSSTAAERVTLLSRLDDPRVVSGVLALLEAPPYRAQTAMPFFRACAKALVESNDQRARAAMLDLSARYKSILETSVGDLVANLLHRSAESMDQVKPGPLPEKYEALATKLEAMFEAERASADVKRSSKRSAEQNDEALLAAIYAAPDDDGPRLVFADVLTERGEVRGEFISLQIQRACGPLSREQFKRERELLRDPKQRAAYALPLSRGGQTRLERGFPSSLVVDHKTVKHVVGSPALRTLTRISFLETLSNKLAREVVQHENASQVQRVGSFKREQFDALKGELPWSDVSLKFMPGESDIARLVKLERLSVNPTGKEPAPRADLSRLQHLAVAGELPEGVLPLAKNVRSVELTLHRDVPEFAANELRALDSLRELRVQYLPSVKFVKGLPLERLDGRYKHDSDISGLIDALPKLKHLHITSDFSEAEMMKKLSAAGARLNQLETLEVADMHFELPFTPKATLRLDISHTMPEYFERLGKMLAMLPEGIAPKAVLMHRLHTDPSVHFIETPSADQLKVLQTNPRVPVELDWY